MASVTRRGASLVEVLLSTAMLAVLVSGAASLFLFVSNRVSADTAQSAVPSQVDMLAEEISTVIGSAKQCTTITSGSVVALRCEMPANGVDTDQDGLLDEFSPSSYDYASDIETFNTGRYVWFYMSDSGGAFGSVGTVLWRAAPTTTANPAIGDRHTNWAKYYGGAPRWNFIDSVTYTVNVAAQSVTVTINGSSYNRAERSAATEPGSSDNTKISVTRTVFWGNYR